MSTWCILPAGSLVSMCFYQIELTWRKDETESTTESAQGPYMRLEYTAYINNK